MKQVITLLFTLLVASLATQAHATSLYNTYFAYAERPGAQLLIACKCDNDNLAYQTYIILMEDGKITITDNRQNYKADGFMLYSSKDQSTFSDLVKHVKAHGRQASTEATAYITLMTDDSSIDPTNTFSRNAYAYFYKRLTELKSAHTTK